MSSLFLRWFFSKNWMLFGLFFSLSFIPSAQAAFRFKEDPLEQVRGESKVEHTVRLQLHNLLETLIKKAQRNKKQSSNPLDMERLKKDPLHQKVDVLFEKVQHKNFKTLGGDIREIAALAKVRLPKVPLLISQKKPLNPKDEKKPMPLRKIGKGEKKAALKEEPTLDEELFKMLAPKVSKKASHPSSLQDPNQKDLITSPLAHYGIHRNDSMVKRLSFSDCFSPLKNMDKVKLASKEKPDQKKKKKKKKEY